MLINNYLKDPYTCWLQETYLKGHKQTESEGLEKRYSMQEKKKAGVAVPISYKIDYEIKAVKRDKGHYIMIKGSIQEEGITLTNIYAPNIGAPQYVR